MGGCQADTGCAPLIVSPSTTLHAAEPREAGATRGRHTGRGPRRGQWGGGTASLPPAWSHRSRHGLWAEQVLPVAGGWWRGQRPQAEPELAHVTGCVSWRDRQVGPFLPAGPRAAGECGKPREGWLLPERLRPQCCSYLLPREGAGLEGAVSPAAERAALGVDGGGAGGRGRGDRHVEQKVKSESCFVLPALCVRHSVPWTWHRPRVPSTATSSPPREQLRDLRPRCPLSPGPLSCWRRWTVFPTVPPAGPRWVPVHTRAVQRGGGSEEDGVTAKGGLPERKGAPSWPSAVDLRKARAPRRSQENGHIDGVQGGAGVQTRRP